MENFLDNVETGALDEVRLLTDFYGPFKQALEKAKEEMVSVKGVGVQTGLECPACGQPLNIKIGKNGHFLACTAYPDCSFTSNYLRDEKGNISIVETKVDNTKVKDCVKCGKPMVKKEGRFGLFLACTGYPDCNHTESVSGGGNAKKIGIKCPTPDCTGEIVEKKSKRGKIFFGCSKFPGCTFATWDKPVEKACPDCERPYLLFKETKRDGQFLKCPNRDCGFKEKI
jgi:DNA topoisomerase-1